MPRSASTHVDDPRSVGRRLREAREAAGVSQRKLAFAGCTSAYISRIEAGQRIPSLQLIHEFARRLRVSPEWLATGVDGDGESAALLDAEVALRLGEVAEARTVYEQRLRDDPQDPVALGGLGALALRESDVDEAIDLLERALDVRQGRILDDPSAVENLARAYAEAGAAEAAIALLTRAVEEAEGAEALVEALRFKVLLANALIDRGEPRRAELILADSISLAVDLRDPLAEARVYWSQSRLHCYHNDPRLGARYARKAIDILERTENQTYVAMAYHLLACAEIEAGSPDEALKHLANGREHFGESLAEYDDAKFAIEETRALLALERVHDAARHVARALDQANVLDPRDRARAYGIAADVFRTTGDVDRALELYDRALASLEESGGPFVVETATRYSELLEELGRTDEALAVLRSAVAGAREHEPRASRR
ncbi:MAG TPA: helix-turn-helix transcriptional regulator [Gaiellaceae bacterium]|nr:helix-turn-helix transcriptional regulator [Gaiellaceae bacterium]